MIKKIRYILTIIVTLLIIKCTIRNTIPGIEYFIFLIASSIYVIINIKDIIRKNSINENTKYNLLQIISLSIIILVFIRTLYDPLFIYNSRYLKDLKQLENNEYIENAKNQTIQYLLQNIYYFIALLFLLLIYRKNTIQKEESKYSSQTLTCLTLSIISIIPSIQCMTNEINTIKYLIFTLIIIGIEVYRLIKDNHKKIEWPIYISWIFNLFALISVIVNLIK